MKKHLSLVLAMVLLLGLLAGCGGKPKQPPDDDAGKSGPDNSQATPGPGHDAGSGDVPQDEDFGQGGAVDDGSGAPVGAVVEDDVTKWADFLAGQGPEYEAQPAPEFDLDDGYDLYACSGLFRYDYPVVLPKEGSTVLPEAAVKTAGKDVAVEFKPQPAYYGRVTLGVGVSNNDGRDTEFEEAVRSRWEESTFVRDSFQTFGDQYYAAEDADLDNTFCRLQMDGESAVMWAQCVRPAVLESSGRTTWYLNVSFRFYRNYHGAYAYACIEPLYTNAYSFFFDSREEALAFRDEFAGWMADLTDQYGIADWSGLLDGTGDFEDYVPA